jgi:lysine/ornithine N-monooxygenase
MTSLSELEPLTELEKCFVDKLHKVFAQVHPQKPEKGVAALLKKAREQAAQSNQSLAEILETLYQGAVERTERRIKLLSQCDIQSRNEPLSHSSDPHS